MGTLPSPWPHDKRAAVKKLWGRCPNMHPWFPIEDPGLEASYLCPVCLVRAQQVRATVLRRLLRRRRRAS